MTNWITKRCPVCGTEFEYPECEYQPKTCPSFECTWEYLHNPEKYESFMDHLDECRVRAGI